MSYKTGFTSTSDSSTNDQPKYQTSDKVIILGQHGYLGNGNQFADCFKKIVEITYTTNENCYHQYSKELKVKNLDSLIDCKEFEEDHKYFMVRTVFSNNIGRVAEQVEELHKIIEKLRTITGITHFYLIGHSKGGLVNMKYSITYPGEVEKLISIGTPYNPNFLGFLQARIDDIFAVQAVTEALHFDGPLAAVHGAIYGLLDHFLCDEDLGSIVFYEQLKKDWRNLPNSYRPIVYAIGASQIGLNKNPNSGGDMIVAFSSQLADGYPYINKRKRIVSKNYEYIALDSFWDYLKLKCNVVEKAKDIYQALEHFNDGVAVLLGFVLAFMVPDNKDNEVYDLIHTRECTNNDVIQAVIEACEFVPTTQDELYPSNNTEY